MGQLKLFDEQDLSQKQDDVLSSILLVFDEKEKKISAVTGIDENGNLKTVAPTAENEGAFMKVDKNANAFSNFFSNFWKQLTNPTGLHFFKSDAKEAIPNARTIEAAIISDDPQKKKEIADKYYVKPGQPGQAEKAEKTTAQQTTPPEQKPAEPAPTPAEKPATFYKREDVNFDSLKHFGISEEMLEKNGQMEKLLNRKLSTETYRAHGKFEGSPVDFDAAIQIGKDPETGKISAMLLGTKKEPDFEHEFFGEKFDEKDQRNLLSTGNLGRVAHLKDYKTGVVEPHILSLDPLTNRYFARKLSSFDKLEYISNAKLTPEIKQELLEGKAVKIPGMKNTQGKPINCPVQLSGHPNKYIDYLHNQGMKQKVNEKGEKVFYGTHIKGVPITPKDVDTLNNKGYLFLKGMRGKDGGTFDSYVIWDSKVGVLRFPKRCPQQSTRENMKEQQPVPRQGTGQNKQGNKQDKENTQGKSMKGETAKQGKEKAAKKSVQKVH